MTTRRKFIQGAVSVAVAASIPGGDGVALYSAKHPEVWTYRDLKFTTEYTYETYDFATHGTRLHEALARSMMQTKEMVAKRVLGKAFPEAELRTPFQKFKDDVLFHFDQAALEEIEIDIPE